MEEIFKPIKNYENLYSISNLGRVKSNNRQRLGAGGSIRNCKGRIFKRFYEALCPGGILFIGSTEQIVNYKEIGFIRNSSFFYQKPL